MCLGSGTRSVMLWRVQSLPVQTAFTPVANDRVSRTLLLRSIILLGIDGHRRSRPSTLNLSQKIPSLVYQHPWSLAQR